MMGENQQTARSVAITKVSPWRLEFCLQQGSHALLKSIEFGQNVHEVLKKYGNSKFSHLSIQILLFTADDLMQMLFA